MDWAARAAQLSHAQRLQVGAVIVHNDTVISYGYNGMPSGWSNICEDVSEDGSLKTKSEVLHAESNAIAKLARSANSGEDADLFVTHSPCMECAKLIYQSGIRRVYYKNNYRDNSGIEFLKKSGVEVHNVS
jgi:dCMP deaminase